ncbi:O-acetyl-ADP-ribose deacetylase 1 [Cryptotermes secundus]|nr:uncharacterized protein LOC111875267 isoform X4 [Cryptotermes secundus]XP_023727134.1 uncharacterized protein LOC111875267 isoform X4 [Cryptotermes secundus]XP_023727135.1 uncharacterized protein LOC111875267 isoform X4 [Cryptotermes secundus]XP_023727136.1 uncharacterized protein LOC111875267 isoform X4 [Cryptotermes secundus]XP_023727137.1 uncharacterized protein LOC111875267 isoform X4 [Cryptotermes secundus]PNF40938.1 O-acetyl-ADP-ribose deacetylase 1 [Cryptotermes secundus]PNF40942.1 
MSKHHKGGNRRKWSSGSSRSAKKEVPVADNITQPRNFKETPAARQGRNPVISELKHQHESCVDVNKDSLQQMGSPDDGNQPESQDANGGSHLVADQASGTQTEHSAQSEYEELPADSSGTTACGMSFLYKCLECQHDNPILREMVYTHPKKDYYIGLLKQQHADHEAKCSAVSKGAAELKTPRQKNSDSQAVYDCSSAKNQRSSSFPVGQRSHSDTTTNDEDKDDNRMDVCNAEERSSLGTPMPAEGRDWFEDSQTEDGEENWDDGMQQGNRRGAVEDHSRERRGESYKRGRQDTDNWRRQDNRRPQDNDSGWSRDDRGKSRGNKKYKIVKEVDGDLFTAPKEYSLAHCVATDMRMGSGIAVSFRQNFKRVGELLDQRARVGHIAVLEHEGRFIYYLVTKRYSNEKPFFQDLVSSLEKMRNHCAEHKVKFLAMPRIGCGLDRLEWREVKPKIEELFSELDISITVYNYNQPEKEEDQYPKSKKTLVVRHQPYPLVDIESLTALLFFGSEDGSVDNCGKTLDCKFNFLPDYKRQMKRIRDIIRLEKKNEVLYGLIVRQKQTDVFSYVNFEKCLYELRKLIKKDDFKYIGIEAFCVNDDEDTMEKVISVMKGVLLAPGLELYVCWPKELAHCHTWSGETR